jgi:hypothetical protein
MALYLLAVSYATMAVAGLVVELVFQALGQVPSNHQVTGLTSNPEWGYTTFLDIGFFVLAMILGYRFLRTGGIDMLRMMEMSPDAMAHAGHERG